MDEEEANASTEVGIKKYTLIEGAEKERINQMNDREFSLNSSKMQMKDPHSSEQGLGENEFDQASQQQQNDQEETKENYSKECSKEDVGVIVPKDDEGDNVSKVNEGDNVPKDNAGDNVPKDEEAYMVPQDNEGDIVPKDDKGNIVPQDNEGDIVPKVNEGDNVPKFDNGDNDNDEGEPNKVTSSSKKEVHKRSFFILLVINVVAFVASFSYWNQNGVLPYLTRKLGVNPEIYGLMESSFAIYQLIGSPLFGRCGDIFGTRIVMVVSEIASAISYGSLAFVNNIPTLFLTRVPAIFMHNLQGSYMIITDVTLPDERANMLGKLGVSHGLGMVAGSFVGGLVSDIFNERTTTIVAACGNLVCVVIIVVFIPNDTKSIRRQLEDVANELTDESPAGQASLSEMFSLKQMCAIFRIDIIKYLLFIKILSAFPFSLLYSMFSIAIMDFYHLGPYHNGLILAYVGLVGIFVQGYLIGLFTKHISDPDLVKYAVFLMASTFLLLTVAESIIFFCILLLPLAIGGITSHLVLLAAITKVVPINDTGTAIGLTLAFHAIVRSIAPTFGGMVFTNIGWPFFGVIGYVIHLFLAGYILLNGRDNY